MQLCLMQLRLQIKDYEKAVKTNHEIKLGLNVIDGKIVYKGVSDAFDFKYHDVDSIIN